MIKCRRKPLIAITPSLDKDIIKINNDYCRAIKSSGGIPILLTYTNFEDIEQILEVVDGIVFSGGGDIHAKFFDQQLDEKANSINVIRDKFEIKLCQLAISRNLPILCICRGMQVLNVALGGNIFQHIENHGFYDKRNEPVHKVHILSKTKLFKIFNQSTVQVNSMHHQAVDRLGGGIIPSAIANDNTNASEQTTGIVPTIIEAIEVTDSKFAVGVQWHPEALYTLQYSLFDEFIKSCIK